MPNFNIWNSCLWGWLDGLPKQVQTSSQNCMNSFMVSCTHSLNSTYFCLWELSLTGERMGWTDYWEKATHEIKMYTGNWKMTNPALFISLPPITWPSQSLVFTPIYLSVSLPIPIPLHLFYFPWSSSQSPQLPLHSLHYPMAKHSDLDSQPPLMWAMWPLRSRCPYVASLILCESRHSPQREPVINPIQPGPPLHCLNTWCITIPTPMHPLRFTQTCMCGRGPMMQ